MVDFGERLKALRLSKGWTQKQLSDKLGLTKSVISAYDTDLRLPSYDVLTHIAAIFGVTTDYLLGMSKEKTIDASKLSEADYLMVVSLVNRLKNDQYCIRTACQRRGILS